MHRMIRVSRKELWRSASAVPIRLSIGHTQRRIPDASSAVLRRAFGTESQPTDSSVVSSLSAAPRDDEQGLQLKSRFKLPLSERVLSRQEMENIEFRVLQKIASARNISAMCQREDLIDLLLESQAHWSQEEELAKATDLVTNMFMQIMPNVDLQRLATALELDKSLSRAEITKIVRDDLQLTREQVMHHVNETQLKEINRRRNSIFDADFFGTAAAKATASSSSGSGESTTSATAQESSPTGTRKTRSSRSKASAKSSAGNGDGLTANALHGADSYQRAFNQFITKMKPRQSTAPLPFHKANSSKMRYSIDDSVRFLDTLQDTRTLTAELVESYLHIADDALAYFEHSSNATGTVSQQSTVAKSATAEEGLHEAPSSSSASQSSRSPLPPLILHINRSDLSTATGVDSANATTAAATTTTTTTTANTASNSNGKKTKKESQHKPMEAAVTVIGSIGGNFQNFLQIISETVAGFPSPRNRLLFVGNVMSPTARAHAAMSALQKNDSKVESPVTDAMITPTDEMEAGGADEEKDDSADSLLPEDEHNKTNEEESNESDEILGEELPRSDEESLAMLTPFAKTAIAKTVATKAAVNNSMAKFGVTTHKSFPQVSQFDGLKCLMALLHMKLSQPDAIYLVRGDEALTFLLHSSRKQSELTGSQRGIKPSLALLWQKLHKIFEQLPVAAVIDNSVFVGSECLGSRTSKMTLAQLESSPQRQLIEMEMSLAGCTHSVWSSNGDPQESMRTFGKCAVTMSATSSFLNRNKLKLLVRCAPPYLPHGFKADMDKKTLSLFSSPHLVLPTLGDSQWHSAQHRYNTGAVLRFGKPKLLDFQVTRFFSRDNDEEY